MTKRNGRCLCGAVTYTVDADPLVVRICWCRDCQHLAANGTVNMLVPTPALSVSGALGAYASKAHSGNEITREFCPQCGTHLFARTDARPQFRVVRVGTLEDPSSVRPSVNIWAASAPAWACLDGALERVDAQPLPPR
jgi:hypothetical protein